MVTKVPTTLINKTGRVSEFNSEAIGCLEEVRILDRLDNFSPVVARQHADGIMNVAELWKAEITGEEDIVDHVWAEVDAVR